ncbi:RNA polymerase factor sigma-54 [Vibrio rumoiensis]
MTPQLQQAIRLLQLSTLDLQQEIQEALDSNPLLELDESVDEVTAQESNGSPKVESEEPSLPEQSEHDMADSSEHIEQSTISDDLSIDASWEDVYSSNTGSTGISQDAELPVYQGETTETLQDYLEWQLELTPFSDTDRTIARAILDALDQHGYLTETLEDIRQSTGNDEIEIDEVEAVLKRIQQFDPLGVASRNLQECLLLQLAIYPKDTPWLTEAKMVLQNHIDQLGNRDYKLICKEAKLKEDELKQVLSLIQQLDPRPGNNVNVDEIEYIVPDVSVFKDKGKWTVAINPDSVPRLKVNQQYAAFSKGNSADSQYIRTHVQEAKWLIKSLESRNETLLKVARCIVEHQQGFFEHGEEAMKPMVLNDIALDVDMHESTISRVTTQKYMHTPRGIFELKYFFSSHVNTDAGGECSSTAIRALIKKLVAAEDSKKPLSDSKIAALLVDQGIQVARRTIAKYRESLGIAPSSQRKRLL